MDWWMDGWMDGLQFGIFYLFSLFIFLLAFALLSMLSVSVYYVLLAHYFALALAHPFAAAKNCRFYYFIVLLIPLACGIRLLCTSFFELQTSVNHFRYMQIWQGGAGTIVLHMGPVINDRAVEKIDFTGMPAMY